MKVFVAGVPVPKGSAKAYVRGGRAIVTQDNREKQKPWASSISWLMQKAMNGRPVMTGAIEISLEFIMPRPKSHYGAGRNENIVKESAPCFHTKKPDLDKLIRLVKDAMTGVVWKDDSQVSVIRDARKIYGSTPGVRITIHNFE